jgi:protein tyrosine phosphatase (PTP) superfamily phosphohydrolase (DUF442 family)
MVFFRRGEKVARRRAADGGNHPRIAARPAGPRSLKVIALFVLSFLTLSGICQGKLFFRHWVPYRFHHTCNPTTISERDIQNFHRVDSDLYRGAPPKCSGYIKLARLGVKTIINLQGGGRGALERCQRKKGLRLRFISFDIPLLETTVTGISDQSLRRLFAMMQRAPKPMFITCRYGEDRTGVIVALYRMKRGEMSFSQAEREALYYGMERYLLPGLKETLDRYKNPQELRSLPAPTLSAFRPESVCYARVIARKTVDGRRYTAYGIGGKTAVAGCPPCILGNGGSWMSFPYTVYRLPSTVYRLQSAFLDSVTPLPSLSKSGMKTISP